MVDISGRKLRFTEGVLEFLKSPFVWGMGAGIFLSWLYISEIGRKGILTMAGLTKAEAERLIAKLEAKAKA